MGGIIKWTVDKLAAADCKTHKCLLCMKVCTLELILTVLSRNHGGHYLKSAKV